MNETQPIINIGRGQRTMRYAVSVLATLFAIGLALFLVTSGANRLWRLALYLPLNVAAGGFFEAQAKTCVVLAGRGECSLDQKFYAGKSVRGDKIQDESLVSQLRQKARQISVRTQVSAIAVTALFFLLPL